MKDVLFYKFRRPMIGPICGAVCTNKRGHRDAFSNEWREVPRVSRGLLSRPPSLERSEKRGLFFVIHSLVVDSTERGRCHCSGEFEQLLLTCIVGCGLQSNTNRFNVRAAAAGMRTVLTIDIPYSGKLSREKTFTNFAIFQPSTKVFSMKF